ncbi:MULTISPECIES: hypothetical protein [Arthrobacter]|uniref:Cardiolipin synthase N-terminal domain-containing protein n=1 Tax=Arthrobacter oryzae TaxID=409290 RepID=A0A3N0C3G1_9MICC|nr:MULTISPECIES: hypothetical protein [Arthrobacter]QYF91157.1 hypothetical protein KY499_08250 [Arthrobacter sp. PAMC25284]RNL57164.1 hypothetical protein D7003_07645 [Arthrobacter oryzae]
MKNKHTGQAVKKSWKELSPKKKLWTAAVGVVQLSLLIAAQWDITRRPAEEIRGSKTLWRLASLVNFVGPGTYFTLGRKRDGIKK